MVRVSRSASRLQDGFDTGRSFLTTRLNQLEKGKPVEPGCDEGAARVETILRAVGDLGVGF